MMRDRVDGVACRCPQRASDVWSLDPLSVCRARGSLAARFLKNASFGTLYS